MKIIDVSRFNGAIDFNKVKNAGVDGVVIRAGYRGYGSGTLVEDSAYRANMCGAVNAGLKLGVYFVTQAVNEAEAIAEADYTIKLVHDYKLSLPVFIDVENGDGAGHTGRADEGKLTRAQRTAIICAFIGEITKQGYKAGVYASESWYDTQFTINKGQAYIWVAKYSTREPNMYYDAWQFTDAGKINGVNSNVDVSTFKAISISQSKPTDTPLQQTTKHKIGDRVRVSSYYASSTDPISKAIIKNAIGTITKIKTGTSNPYLLDNGAIGWCNDGDIRGFAGETAGKEYYVIKKGDTLSSIAKNYNTTVNKLVDLNGIKNANKIYAGQRIRVK